MRTLVSLADISHDEWLAARRRGIGSSSAAAALGMSPWKSPFALWAELTGLADAPNLDDNESVEWGTALEPLVAEKYHRVTQRNIRRPTHIYQHDTYDWMIGNPDRFIDDGSRGTGILEVKTTGAFHAQEWEEEAPVHYQIQLQHLLAVTGSQWGSFAVLIGGQKFRWQDVERNESFIRYMIACEEEFWDRVMRGDPPPVDASYSTREALQLLYPADTGESKALPMEASQWIERRRALKDEERRISFEIQGIENRIKAELGEASTGLLPDGSGFSWKVQRRDGYTVAPSEHRILREIKPKRGNP